MNHDLKLLNTWLRANRISINASKTEIILFKPKSWANITKHLNFRISGQQIERINQVKYLSLVVNEFFEWRTHFIHLKKNLKLSVYFLKLAITYHKTL